MNPLLPQLIETAKLRANPAYELVLYDRLPAAQQQVLHGIQDDPEFYGILRPYQVNGLSVKSVNQDTALLFLTLQVPGRLPGYVQAALGSAAVPAVAELLLDGILEIEHDGQFISGAAAYGVIYGTQVNGPAQGANARLSLEAIQYAQALGIQDTMKLSARMYFYNRLPVSPRWRQQLPSSQAVFEHLGIAEGGRARHTLDRHWSVVPLEPPNDGWSMWRLRPANGKPRKARLAYKLYVSPDVAHLHEIFQAVLTALTELETPCFKIGNDVYGLFRPDKFVAYFTTEEAMQAVAERLARALDGCPAHGVPFTAGLTNDGLLSWGMDPPTPKGAILWQERESWRLWVTNRLAVALLAAKAAPTATMEPWQFALERLRLDGVDPATWTPMETIWQGSTPVKG